MSDEAMRSELEELDRQIREAEAANKALVEPALARRRVDAKKRDLAAQKALLKARTELGVDRVMVYRMPRDWGGCIIARKWPPEVLRRLQDKMLGKRSDLDSTTCVTLMQEPNFVLHPPIEELQRWEDEFPALSVEAVNSFYGECSSAGDNGGK